jgi:hypothetical protein
VTSSDLEDRIFDRLSRRGWPIIVSTVFFGLGLGYFFRWAPIVRHKPSQWVTPGDLYATYQSSSALAHGHFGAIYGTGFLAFPGMALVLAPLGALANVFHTTAVQITHSGQPLPGLHFYLIPYTLFGVLDVGRSGGKLYAFHRQAFVLLGPIALVLSCVVLFALDALAEQLRIDRIRRAVLCLTEAVLLWNVTVIWGHPEDAVALALGVYALIFAFEGRFTGAGWLFGAGLAIQPLVIVLFPLFLALGGRNRAVGLVTRAVVPAAALTIAPLVGDVHTTLHALVDQPTFPDLRGNHQTLWTFLAPRLGGRGDNLTVGGGPLRIVALALAAGLGWWAVRWRERPEMIVWAAALALAFRTYTESVMTPYYVWPPLAVGVLVAARGATWRFATAVGVAVATTVVAQWHLGWLPWWLVQVIGVTVLLVVAAAPRPAGSAAEPVRARATPVPVRSAPSKSKQQKSKQKPKSARADRKRSARR